MNTASSFQAFFLSVAFLPIKGWHISLKLISRIPLLQSIVQPDMPSVQSPTPIDTETTKEALEQQQHFQQPITPVGQHNAEWAKLIIAFCFASAIQLATQSTQTTQSQHPLLLYLLCLSVSLAFSSLFVAKFIDSKLPFMALALEQAAVFFAATAFFLAVSLPFPLYIKCTTYAIYAVSLLVILLCHLRCLTARMSSQAGELS